MAVNSEKISMRDLETTCLDASETPEEVAWLVVLGEEPMFIEVPPSCLKGYSPYRKNLEKLKAVLKYK
jgi:hypothetical protein